jgi:hypothetical protein
LSTSFWPILSPSGEGFIKEAKGCINLPTYKIFFNPGKGEKGVLGNIDLPKARHCFMYRRTLDTIQTGGTNHSLTPFHLTVNASIPIRGYT